VVGSGATSVAVPGAVPGAVLPPLRLGRHVIESPVVLAPMAGITNRAFRRLCREFGPGLLYVNEMVTARALVEGNEKTKRMLRFDADEQPRSAQLYGTAPGTMFEAVRRLVDDHGVEHVDLNFGCPVPKVTRKGGGAALPVLSFHPRAARPNGTGPTRSVSSEVCDDDEDTNGSSVGDRVHVGAGHQRRQPVCPHGLREEARLRVPAAQRRAPTSHPRLRRPRRGAQRPFRSN